MVNPTPGVSSLQNVSSANKAQETQVREQKSEERRTEARRDEVEMSDEAVQRLEAERAAEQARAALERDQELTLADERIEEQEDA